MAIRTADSANVSWFFINKAENQNFSGRGINQEVFFLTGFPATHKL
jgi:hypothetical protein